jgi:hypothetical protein
MHWLEGKLERIGLRRRTIFFHQLYVGVCGVFELGPPAHIRLERGLLKLGKCDQVFDHLDSPRQSLFTRQRLHVWSKRSIRDLFAFGTGLWPVDLAAWCRESVKGPERGVGLTLFSASKAVVFGGLPTDVQLLPV